MHAKTRLAGAILIWAMPAIGFAMNDSDMPGMDHSNHQHGQAFSFGHPGRAAEVTRTVAVAMNEMSFSPAMLELKKGETIRFVVNNKSDVDHEMTLGDEPLQAAHRKEMLAMAESGMTMNHHGDVNAVSVPAGKSGELIWTFTEATTIEFDCDIPGHYEAGMKGVIVIR